jgi:ribosomal protein L27
VGSRAWRHHKGRLRDRGTHYNSGSVGAVGTDAPTGYQRVDGGVDFEVADEVSEVYLGIQ